MGDRFVGADKPGAELHAGRAHLEIGQHRLAAPDAAGDEHRHLAEMRQHLLRQHRGRYRADMAAGFAAFDDDRVGADAHQLVRDRQRRREADDPRAAVADPLDRRDAGHAAGEHDMADAPGEADIDQLDAAAGAS